MDDGFVDRVDQFGIVFPDADVGIGEVFVGREGIIQYGERLAALALEEFVPGQPVHEDDVQLSGAEGVEQLLIGRKTDDFATLTQCLRRKISCCV